MFYEVGLLVFSYKSTNYSVISTQLTPSFFACQPPPPLKKKKKKKKKEEKKQHTKNPQLKIQTKTTKLHNKNKPTTKTNNNKQTNKQPQLIRQKLATCAICSCIFNATANSMEHVKGRFLRF